MVRVVCLAATLLFVSVVGAAASPMEFTITGILGKYSYYTATNTKGAPKIDLSFQPFTVTGLVEGSGGSSSISGLWSTTPTFNIGGITFTPYNLDPYFHYYYTQTANAAGVQTAGLWVAKQGSIDSNRMSGTFATPIAGPANVLTTIDGVPLSSSISANMTMSGLAGDLLYSAGYPNMSYTTITSITLKEVPTTETPEPSSLFLMGTGALALARNYRRSKRT